MKHLIYKGLRKIGRGNSYTNKYVDIYGQEANDYIAYRIRNNKKGLMISKFGTIELDNIICNEVTVHGKTIRDYYHGIRGEYSIHQDEAFEKLCNNAGFFPKEISMINRYSKLVRNDIKEIDILGSYLKAEKYIANCLDHQCKKVNLDGYYAPFLWKNPWTKELKDKKVLVVHPFVESIAEQYRKRDKLFENPEVLPSFNKLYLTKAVQSIAGNGGSTGFKDWFEALEYMKTEMDKCDYDVALIGCGAYGMNLAAHAKRQGKIAVHMAGWTQMLFGIYGKRWTSDQPQYSKYINEYWIRPKESERPVGSENVEGGCYW